MTHEEYRAYILANIIVEDNGCWPWQGSIGSDKGYGTGTRLDNCKWVHRNSHVVFKGKIEWYQVVRHTCDNPPCCNPEHLIACHPSENVHDCIEKGRNFVNRSGPGNKFDRAVYEQVRSLYAQGNITVAEIARTCNMSHRQAKRIINNEVSNEPI